MDGESPLLDSPFLQEHSKSSRLRASRSHRYNWLGTIEVVVIGLSLGRYGKIVSMY